MIPFSFFRVLISLTKQHLHRCHRLHKSAKADNLPYMRTPRAATHCIRRHACLPRTTANSPSSAHLDNQEYHESPLCVAEMQQAMRIQEHAHTSHTWSMLASLHLSFLLHQNTHEHQSPRDSRMWLRKTHACT